MQLTLLPPAPRRRVVLTPWGRRQCTERELCRVHRGPGVTVMVPSMAVVAMLQRQWELHRVFERPPGAAYVTSQWRWHGGGDPWPFLQLMAVPSHHHAPGTDMRQVDGDLWELYSTPPAAWHSRLLDAQKKAPPVRAGLVIRNSLSG